MIIQGGQRSLRSMQAMSTREEPLSQSPNTRVFKFYRRPRRHSFEHDQILAEAESNSVLHQIIRSHPTVDFSDSIFSVR